MENDLNGRQPLSPNGDILVCSSVRAVNVLPHAKRVAPLDHAEKASRQHHHSQVWRPPQRQKSPSYQRRLRKRAAARAAVTAEKAKQTSTEVQPVPVLPPPTNMVPSDELCPDKDYHAVAAAQHHHQAEHVALQQPHHSIPQLDGHMSPSQVADRMWSCKCCEYEHFFQTENDLKKHHDDTLIFTYEECNICYPWHIWIPRC